MAVVVENRGIERRGAIEVTKIRSFVSRRDRTILSLSLSLQMAVVVVDWN